MSNKNQPAVVHCKREPFHVYIGRPMRGYRSEGWGNPFKIGRDGTRGEVIAKYRAWISDQPELQARAHRELRGKILACWCAPLPCHGDVLLEIANGVDEGAGG